MNSINTWTLESPPILREEDLKLSSELTPFLNRHIQIRQDFCGSFYATGVKTTLGKFFCVKKNKTYNEDKALEHLKKLTNEKIERAKNGEIEKPFGFYQTIPVGVVSKNQVEASCRAPFDEAKIPLLFNKHIQIQQDFCGNFYATGEGGALREFYQVLWNASYTNEEVLSPLQKLTHEKIEGIKNEALAGSKRKHALLLDEDDSEWADILCQAIDSKENALQTDGNLDSD